mmetsp:Transcript_72860/g.117448  ORF Transcript_72860/g.117448 Transcript_72860/m.117448 type:complete len:134 (+) Transcript_72860:2-403(+)
MERAVSTSGMAGLLRAALAANARASPRLPASLTQANRASMPFIPQDWVFRFFPGLTRDKVRFMLRFNQVSFSMGLGFFYLWCHTPYKCDQYDHFEESYLFSWVKGNMQKTGEYDENVRIKVRHFYPQTAELEE